MLATPVLFIVFNRPDTTARVLEQIRKAAPKQLFIAADGPRPDKSSDEEKIREVRRIVSQVDWDCEVRTLFREENLGCGPAVSQAISWFFSEVTYGIILEDDTLPDLSFFRYCETLLKLYENNHQVMHISGTSFTQKSHSSPDAYYCSIYPNIWGWASWARAWKNYNFELDKLGSFDEVLANGNVRMSREEVMLWKKCFENLKYNVNFTWDYQWFFSLWNSGGICITPTTNMVTNIGFGLDSTHTEDAGWKIANIPAGESRFPLKHVQNLVVDKRRDYQTFKIAHCLPGTLANKLRNLSYKIISYEKRKRYFGI